MEQKSNRHKLVLFKELISNQYAKMNRLHTSRNGVFPVFARDFPRICVVFQLNTISYVADIA